MIILITGNMGTGKTSKVIQMIIDNEDKLAQMPVYDTDGKTILDWIKRPIYTAHIDGIDEIKLGVCSVTHEHMKSDTLENLFPVGSLIIVDECHYVYPVRPSTKAVPDYISKLTELRHQGHTLIIMTQHPSNIDSYVRNLVSRHIHLARKQATTRLYEWNECVTSFSPMMLKEATSRLYKPPKKAFDYYKSSSVHVKHKRRVSPMVYVLFACIGMILLSAWYMSNRIKETTQKPIAVDVLPQNQIESQMNNDVLQPVPVASGTSSATLSKSLTPQHFTPVLPEMPESKPIYDDVRKVQSFEYPVALIESNGVCKAYSDQGTLLDIPQAFCKKWLKDGRYNPYKSSSQSVNQSTIQQPTNKE